VKAFLTYSVARLAVFAVVATVLYFVGLRSFLLVAVALLISLPLSYFALRRQREALAAAVEHRVEGRRQRRTEIRDQLRGDGD
jgi:Flp pilus assembly protein TadB